MAVIEEVRRPADNRRLVQTPARKKLQNKVEKKKGEVRAPKFTIHHFKCVVVCRHGVEAGNEAGRKANPCVLSE